jgi:hypothetical protein
MRCSDKVLLVDRRIEQCKCTSTANNAWPLFQALSCGGDGEMWIATRDAWILTKYA